MVEFEPQAAVETELLPAVAEALQSSVTTGDCIFSFLLFFALAVSYPTGAEVPSLRFPFLVLLTSFQLSGVLLYCMG